MELLLLLFDGRYLAERGKFGLGVGWIGWGVVDGMEGMGDEVEDDFGFNECLFCCEIFLFFWKFAMGMRVPCVERSIL